MNRLLFLLPLLFIACGPTITKSPLLKDNKNPYVAFIPTSSSEGISRERLNYISELAKLNLESKGYILLQREVIESMCVDLECSNIDNISSKYKIGKIAHLNLESSSSLDFLAGYYSSLTGQFIIEDTSGRSLYSAMHTERDSGGVILESGQIIQAIINQIRNGDESSVDRLSYKFTKALLKEVPKGESKNTLSPELKLENITVDNFKKGTKKVCIYGSENQSAWLISPKREAAELKEIKSGTYCGVFRLEGPWSIDLGLKVELRSPFGNIIREEVGI